MKYSIIITTYNSEKYIKRCLDSIINQTIKIFEVIIIDDGSTDNTKNIIKPYLKEKYIKYYYKENTGVADSRNYGIKKVKTPYFLFIDSDDYVESNLIETINKYDNYDLLSFKAYKADKKGNIIEKLNKNVPNISNGEQYLTKLMENRRLNFFLVPWGYVYNLDFWKKNHFKYSKDYVMEDAGLIPIIILSAKNIVTLDYYGYYYVQTNESIMRTSKNKKIKLKTKSILFQFDYLINYINSKDYSNDFKRNFLDYFSGWILWYGTTLRNKDLNSYIKELNKRKILNNLIIKNYKVAIKIFICKINYKFYFKLYNFMLKLKR